MDICGLEVGRTDGISMLPTLLGRPDEQKKHDYLYWYYSYKAAVRKGKWKAIRYHAHKPGQTDRTVLYDLQSDISETNDLSAQHPEKLAEMVEILDKHVLPGKRMKK